MIFLPELAEYVQTPSTPLPDQTENGRKVVGKDDETKPTAINGPCGLEDLIVLLSDDSSTALRVCGDGVRVLPSSAFIELQELLSDVLDVMKNGSDWKAQWQQGDVYIVIAAEQNQENADGGRKHKQPVL